MLLNFPPGLLLIATTLFAACFKGNIQRFFILTAPIMTLAWIWLLPASASFSFSFLEYELNLLAPSKTGMVFATVFAIMAFTGGLFAINQNNLKEVIVAYIYAGAAISITFVGDLISLFIFWELMALSSTLVIWFAHNENAYQASIRYLLIHLLGGVLLMVGIIGYISDTGSITFEIIHTTHWSKWLILAGFLINAGAVPFSSWISDAYPEASYSGSVFLSAFTTKTAVYVLIIAFPGTKLLIPIGLCMIFYGIIYALLENDMRRILAYSIVNQVGFMITGIGIGTEMAINGAIAHAFCHIIYKGLLLMSAGSVLLQTGKRKCTDLGGLFQSMPLTTLFGIIGALAISSFPYTSGFISKSLISQSAANEHLVMVWYLLTAASAGVFLHAGIKFPWFVFFQKDSGLRPKEPPFNMLIAMGFFAFLCIGIGFFPNLLYEILPYSVDYKPYTASHLITQFQLLLFAGLAFFIMLPMMKRTLTITLDFDWFYRVLGSKLGNYLIQIITSIGKITNYSSAMIAHQIGKAIKPDRQRPNLAKSWPTGSMILWVAIIFLMFLLIDLIKNNR